MSRETTQARAAARAAASSWRAHRANCPKCVKVLAKGHGPGPCRKGAPLLLVHLAAQRELQRNRELDKQPPAGQDTLF